MSALICGSLAFDTITVFPGRFKEQILPEQLHILNVSFFVPTLRREYGGCAGNIAYNLNLLGGSAVVMAVLGNDGADYVARLQSWGCSTAQVRVVEDSYTAQAFIITDTDNNQITAFHPGAMNEAHHTAVPASSELKVAIIAPDGRDAMIQHAAQLSAAGIPFVFDPGQGLPMFNGDELNHFVSQATWVTLNDYEAPQGWQGPNTPTIKALTDVVTEMVKDDPLRFVYRDKRILPGGIVHPFIEWRQLQSLQKFERQDNAQPQAHGHEYPQQMQRI